jgi:DNA-binding beta-propeller fold protein YncE
VIARLRVPAATRDDTTTWSLSITAGASGDRRHVDGAGLASTRLVGPCGLALSSDGQTLFVADADDDTIRTVNVSSGASSTLFGVSGAPGNLDDLLSGPSAVALDASETELFIADTDNHRVRRLTLASGAIVDVIGTGEAASSGDGAPATAFPVDSPRGLALDKVGNLIVTSTRTVRLVTADAAGVVDGTGSVVTLYGAVPRDTFPQDSTFCLSGLEVVADDELRVVDACQGYLLDLRRAAKPSVGP